MNLFDWIAISERPNPRPRPRLPLELFVPEAPPEVFRTRAEFGDVLGVSRGIYKHFGVYVGGDQVIHYASSTGDFGRDICIHETSLSRFLDGASSYFVCVFPESWGRPAEIRIYAASLARAFGPVVAPIALLPLLRDLFRLLNSRRYKLYSLEETVERARSRLGERFYNLAINNCEHFAIWCKTGISESHQVNALLDSILGISVPIDI